MGEHKAILIAAMLVTLGLAGCLNASQEGGHGSYGVVNPIESSNSSFTSEEHGFQFVYPEQWSAIDNHPVAVVAVTEPLANSTDAFRENLNVVVTDLGWSAVTLGGYVNTTLHDLENYFPNATLVGESRGTLGGQEAHAIVWRNLHEGHNLIYRSIFTLHNGSAYIVTITAEETPEGVIKSPEFLDGARAAVESFEFLKGPQLVDPLRITIVEGSDVTAFEVRVTNRLNVPVEVQRSAFLLVDGSGTVYETSEQVDYAYGSRAFPYYMTLYPMESAQGGIGFIVPDEAEPPFTLKYRSGDLNIEHQTLLTN